MKYLIVIMFILGASELKAETTLFAHTVSYHVNRAADYNEQNYGLGVRHHIKKDEYITGGSYKNSEYNQSDYAGYGWEFGEGDFKLGLSAGLITGYSLGEVLPYIVPVIKYQNISLIFNAYPEAVVHLTIDMGSF